MVNQKRGSVAALLLLIVGVLAGCAYTDTQPNEISCVRNGGPMDNSNFREAVDPGKGREYVGISSNIVNVPVDARDYTISLDPNKGDTKTADAITVALSGINESFEPTIYFGFNGSLVESGGKVMPMACEWVITQGSKLGATDFNTDGGNWQLRYLPIKFRPLVNNTFIEVAQEMAGKVENTPFALWANATIEIDGQKVPARDYLAAEVGRRLPGKFKDVYGHPYFCGRYVAPDRSFVQDGKVTGEPECPPMPVVISTQPQGIDETVLNNWKAAQSALINRQAAEAAAREAATQEQNLAGINATKAEEVAAANTRSAAAEAKAQADQAAVRAAEAVRFADAQVTEAAAQARVAEAAAAVKSAEAKAAMADCLVVGATGQDCALLQAALKGDYPDIVVGSGGAQVQVPVR